MSAAVESLAIIGRAYSFGVNRVTTTLVLLGPVLIAVLAVAGRNPLTLALGGAYVLVVPVSVVYFWLSEREPDAGDRRAATDGDVEAERDDPDDGDGVADSDATDDGQKTHGDGTADEQRRAGPERERGDGD